MHGTPADDAGTSVVEAWLTHRLRHAGESAVPHDRAEGDNPTDGLLHRVDDGAEGRTGVGGAETDDSFDPDQAWLARACPDLPPIPTIERVAALRSLIARVQAMEAAALADLTRAMSGEPGPEPQLDGSFVTPARAPVAPQVIDATAPALCLGRAAAARRIADADADADQLTRCLHSTHQS